MDFSDVKLADLRLAPNLISISRILMIIPIVFLYGKDDQTSRIAVLALLALSFFTDFLDGYLARKMNQTTALGLVLDPIADKSWTWVMVFLLYTYRDFPLWIAVLVIVRDVGIFALSRLKAKRSFVIIPSDGFGKKYTLIAGLAVIGFTLEISQSIYLAYLLVALAPINLYRYGRSYYRYVRELNEKEHKAAEVI